MARIRPLKTFGSTVRTFLAHRPSFWVSIFCQICLGVAVAAFVTTFAQQAFKGVAKRWNIVIIVGLTVGVVSRDVALVPSWCINLITVLAATHSYYPRSS